MNKLITLWNREDIKHNRNRIMRSIVYWTLLGVVLLFSVIMLQY